MNDVTESPRRPTLFYVHGVGGPKSGWVRVLQKRVRSLDQSIASELDAIVTVDFSHLLRKRGNDDSPPPTHKLAPCPLSTVEQRLQYDDLQRQLTKDFAKFRGPKTLARHTPDLVLEKAGRVVRKRHLKEAKRYVRRRVQVTEFLFAEFDRAGSSDMIVIAHSLGSVVMADVLPLLGPERHIRLLVTVGSPMGVTGVWKKTRKPLKRDFPYGSVSAWINIWSSSDYVSSFRGFKEVFPQAVDVRIAFRGKKWKRPKGATNWKHATSLITRRHALRGYANHPALGHAIAWAFRLGSRAAGQQQGQ